MGGDPTDTRNFKRKLTAVFSADVTGYSRLMGEGQAATVKTLEDYKEVMSSLLKQHRGRVVSHKKREPSQPYAQMRRLY